jgi:hypothetical protein
MKAPVDPGRAAIELALDDAEQRVARLRAKGVRLICGEIRWWSPELIRARTELSRAIADREAARELLAELGAIDAAGGGA